jgi:Dullard-like phosphatase family protein
MTSFVIPNKKRKSIILKTKLKQANTLRNKSRKVKKHSQFLCLRKRIKLNKKRIKNCTLTVDKVSLERFETSVFNNQGIKFIDSFQNTKGNYYNYVSNTLSNLINFDKIDFKSEVSKKSVFLQNSSKKSLFIDLDETLFHVDFDYFYDSHHCYLEFFNESNSVTIPLILRPYLKEFLDYCYEKFDLYIFTASRKQYADCILDYIERDRQYFKQRFYRENCIIIKDTFYIKDLRIFQNRDLKDIIIIDNNLYSFSNQLSNGILITSFYNDYQDKELVYVKNYIENLGLADVNDIRTINKKTFNFELIKETLTKNLI